VLAVAEAHGGSANAQNRAGGGADVWLTLPTAAPVAVDRGSGIIGAV
jgi:signal transduction histidine kinase